LGGQTQHRGSFDDERIARIEAALCPYPWKRMTRPAVARTIVAALPREAWDEAVPDEHVLWMVERSLAECRWRSLTAAGVARQALRALDSWEASLRRLDVELARLLAS
jgi:hypothetical protein